MTMEKLHEEMFDATNIRVKATLVAFWTDENGVEQSHHIHQDTEYRGIVFAGAKPNQKEPVTVISLGAIPDITKSVAGIHAHLLSGHEHDQESLAAVWSEMMTGKHTRMPFAMALHRAHMIAAEEAVLRKLTNQEQDDGPE